MSRRRLVVIALPLVVALAAVGYGVNVYYGIDDAYAQWGAADMCIDYMEDHAGRWPPDWEAIRPYFDAGGSRIGGWTFDQYRNRVVIDFAVDADDLRRQSLAADRPTFNVIRARWTFGIRFDDGPNASLYRYFRGDNEMEIDPLLVPARPSQ